MRLLQLRRLSLVIFAFIYSVCSTGIALQAHYCGGEFYSVEFAFGTDDKGCGCQKKSEPCCKDVTGFFAVEDDQHGGSGFVIPQKYLAAQELSYAHAFNTGSLLSVYVPDISADDPPKEAALPIYLTVRNLRN